jgi:hypothetical protein
MARGAVVLAPAGQGAGGGRAPGCGGHDPVPAAPSERDSWARSRYWRS